ncbi:MAG: hypothetical protein KGL77_01890 [Actinomycetales bacterium]|nr:hypothetical protein [Actinomycetales bacterium]
MRIITGLAITVLTAGALSGCSSNGLPGGCNVPSEAVQDVKDSIASQENWAKTVGTAQESNLRFRVGNAAVMTYPKCFMPEYVAKYEEVWGPANWNDDPNYSTD